MVSYKNIFPYINCSGNVNIVLRHMESRRIMIYPSYFNSFRHFLKIKSWQNIHFHSVNDVWSAIWVRIVSEIWKHKNNVIFKNDVTDAWNVHNDSIKGLVLVLFQSLDLVRSFTLTGVWTLWFVWSWVLNVFFASFILSGYAVLSLW